MPARAVQAVVPERFEVKPVKLFLRIAVVSLLVCLTLTQAARATTDGENGIQVFDSAEVSPGVKPSFTFRYLSKMRSQQGTGDIIIQLLDESMGKGMSVRIGVTRMELGTEIVDMAEMHGYDRFFNGLGTGLTPPGGTYDGEEEFELQGHKAADMYNTSTLDIDGVSSTIFGASRAVFGKSGNLIMIGCFSFFPPDEARERSYTSRSNQLMTEYCRPALDSLSISD
ncbi:MAG: hypothetical protein LBT40_18220 [Deltaproteobacteria bacterium]|jgi:hypothetical protein|nr:hypothetical protein [Deltaproteobacteria bacterium]